MTIRSIASAICTRAIRCLRSGSPMHACSGCDDEPSRQCARAGIALGGRQTGGMVASRYTEIVRAAARFLRRDDGPSVAVFDTSGWDTHANEGGAQGQLATRLRRSIRRCARSRRSWERRVERTVVLLATEFGRTAAINGTRGTDHGTATVAFVLGGAVQGGRVQTDWPGLAARSLYQGRDLRPTCDLRSVLKAILSEHLRVAFASARELGFPGQRIGQVVSGLVRG